MKWFLFVLIFMGTEEERRPATEVYGPFETEKACLMKQKTVQGAERMACRLLEYSE